MTVVGDDDSSWRWWQYRRSTNLACGGAKTFSHPPYSQYGFIYFQTESCFEHFGGFDMAPPRGFLNFYLEPPNLPPFIPKWPPHWEPKNWWNFFSWFLFIFWLNSVIWCLYQLSMIFSWFILQFLIKKIHFENLRIKDLKFKRYFFYWKILQQNKKIRNIVGKNII